MTCAPFARCGNLRTENRSHDVVQTWIYKQCAFKISVAREYGQWSLHVAQESFRRIRSSGCRRVASRLIKCLSFFLLFGTFFYIEETTQFLEATHKKRIRPLGRVISKSASELKLADRNISNLSLHGRDRSALNETTKNFQYEVYWNEILELARGIPLAAIDENTSSAGTSCPKVFVYENLPSDVVDMSTEDVRNQALVFGKQDETNEGFYKTNDYALASIMLYRLEREGSACRTRDPEKADLFFVPTLVKPKKSSAWMGACQKANQSGVLEGLQKLEYLNESTSCRHVFVVSKNHVAGRLCTGWYSEPVPVFQCAMRISYSYVPRRAQLLDGSHYKQGGDNDEDSKYPNLHSVPYPSDVHWAARMNSTPPWMRQNPEDRPILMVFTGSDWHGDRPVRTLIRQMCLSYRDESICTYKSYSREASLTLKGTARFCLEPGGDTPWRKSISDSITMGCVPVTFSNATAHFAPWHWADWRAVGQVHVPRLAFVQGKVDLKRLLLNIPNELSIKMRRAIAIHGQRWQYALDDSLGDDAFNTLLNGAVSQSRQVCARKQCRGKGVVDVASPVRTEIEDDFL